MYAAGLGSYDKTRVLLQYGADPRIRDSVRVCTQSFWLPHIDVA